MEKTAAESWDVKRFEKMFKKQLNEIEIDKEMLEIKLKNKTTEMNELHMQLRDKEVFKQILRQKNVFSIEFRV